MKIKRIGQRWMILAAITISSAGYGQNKQAKSKQTRTFSIAVIPDTQYNTEESQGGNNKLFETQIDWVLANRERENIVYLAHLGDITDKGDRKPEQWVNAVKAISPLEKPLPGLPDGLPYGLAIGNHDQHPSQFAKSGKTFYFNKYFGVDHYRGRSYYGGNFGTDNDSHYDLISANGLDLIIIYIEYDAFDEQQEAMNDWAVDILQQHKDRKAIIVSHYIIGFNPVAGSNIAGQATFGKQGQRLYDRMKTQKNVFLMLCGHVGANGEGYRQDTYDGHTIKTMLSDYQSRPMGGNGMMRLLTFDVDNDAIHVRTLSPYHNFEEKDADSEFTLPLFREPAASRQFDIAMEGKSELLRYVDGNWYGTDNFIASFGQKGDIPVPGNYLSYGKSSPATYRPSEGAFYLADWKALPLGMKGDVPVPADYNGDGLTDAAVWRAETAEWLIDGQPAKKHGWKESLPLPADYDGDGAAETAVWRFTNHTWYIASLGNVPFGENGDVPLPADYNGDGKSEIAVWRPSSGEWLIYGQEKPLATLGKPGDLPVPADYNGSGKIQPAVFDPKTKMMTFMDGKQLKLDASVKEMVNLPFAIKHYYLGILSNR